MDKIFFLLAFASPAVMTFGRSWMSYWLSVLFGVLLIATEVFLWEFSAFGGCKTIGCGDGIVAFTYIVLGTLLLLIASVAKAAFLLFIARKTKARLGTGD